MLRTNNHATIRAALGFVAAKYGTSHNSSFMGNTPVQAVVAGVPSANWR
jgi:hypothetical protein